jgi:hypothetical protein
MQGDRGVRSKHVHWRISSYRGFHYLDYSCYSHTVFVRKCVVLALQLFIEIVLPHTQQVGSSR